MKNMYYSRVVHKGGHIFEIYRVTQKKGKRFEPLNCGTVLPHTYSLKDGINHKCSGIKEIFMQNIWMGVI